MIVYASQKQLNANALTPESRMDNFMHYATHDNVHNMNQLVLVLYLLRKPYTGCLKLQENIKQVPSYLRPEISFWSDLSINNVPTGPTVTKVLLTFIFKYNK